LFTGLFLLVEGGFARADGSGPAYGKLEG
jgi:hypothetical protein